MSEIFYAILNFICIQDHNVWTSCGAKNVSQIIFFTLNYILLFILTS
jgi:hypothetical protein